MAYDDSSFVGDLICYEYDEQNNFMNPQSSFGSLVYYLVGGGFDMINGACEEFMNNFSILSANTKGLDSFWGVSYDMPRPLLPSNYSLIFDDEGITTNNKLDYWYWNTNYGTGSVSDDGTTFNATTTSYLTVNTTLTSPSTSNTYIYDFPLIIEFDIVSFNEPSGITSSYSRVRVYNNNNNKIAYWNIKDYGVGHYKIVCSNGSQKLYFNGVEQSRSFTFTPTTNWNVAFQTYGNIKFKNFKIYDMNAPSTRLMTDEEYRIYLYLRNCRLLTLEDLEINFNKCFGLDNYDVKFFYEQAYLQTVDHLNYESIETTSSNIAKNSEDDGLNFIINHDSDEETLKLQGGLSSYEQKYLVVSIPANNWDKNFLEYMEQYVSVKGNVKIREYQL